jgi:hypothetical protein
MEINWPVVWSFLWPILREALIAFLVAVLTLLGYDSNVLPARLREFNLRERQARKG